MTSRHYTRITSALSLLFSFSLVCAMQIKTLINTTDNSVSKNERALALHRAAATASEDMQTRLATVSQLLASMTEEELDMREPGTGGTALHIAIYNFNYEIARLLAQHKGFNINATDNKGKTALLHACEYIKTGKYGGVGLLNSLLENEAVDTSKVDSSGYSVLHALGLDRPECIEALVQRGAPALAVWRREVGNACMLTLFYDRWLKNPKRMNMNTLKHLLDAQDVKDILEKDPLSAQAVKIIGLLACTVENINNPVQRLIFFIRRNKPLPHIQECIKQVFDTQGDINGMCIERPSWNALLYASALGRGDIIDSLIEAGCELDRSWMGTISEPLRPDVKSAHHDESDKAQSNTDSEEVVLVQSHIHPSQAKEVTFYAKYQPEQLARKNGHKEVERLFADYELFLTSIQNKDTQKVTELLRSGLDISARISDSKTALHIACERGYNELVQILLETGVDIHRADKKGLTPLAYAALDRNKQSIADLIDHGASIGDALKGLELQSISSKSYKDAQQFLITYIGLPLDDAAKLSGVGVLDNEQKDIFSRCVEDLLRKKELSSKDSAIIAAYAELIGEKINEPLPASGNAIIDVIIAMRNIPLLKQVVRLPHFKPQHKNKRGVPPLLFLCKVIDATPRYDKSFALEALNTLLDHKDIDIDTSDAHGLTALDHAVTLDVDMVKQLLNHNARIRQQTLSTALHRFIVSQNSLETNKETRECYLLLLKKTFEQKKCAECSVKHASIQCKSCHAVYYCAQNCLWNNWEKAHKHFCRTLRESQKAPSAQEEKRSAMAAHVPESISTPSLGPTEKASQQVSSSALAALAASVVYTPTNNVLSPLADPRRKGLSESVSSPTYPVQKSESSQRIIQMEPLDSEALSASMILDTPAQPASITLASGD